MPPHNGLGLNNAQDIFPPRPDTGEGDPEGAIDGCKSRSRTLHGIGRKLLAEGQLDDRLLTPASEEGPHGREKDRQISDQDSDHVAILREDALECETDSESETRISSIVDRPVVETKRFNDSGSDGY